LILRKWCRFVTLLFFVILAAIIPVPIIFYQKDKLPTFRIEQFDRKEDEENEDENIQYIS